MSFLPRFMLLKSNANGKFLCYGKDKLIKGGAPTTNLTFSHEINSQEAGVAAADQLVVEPKRTAGAESSGPKDFHMIKFEVEEAKTAPGLVHIRTCYNNKYWVRKSVECNKIVAEAHKPEEDQSKWACTLFKPILVGDAHGDGEANKGGVFDNHHGYGKPAQQIQLMHVNQLGQHYTSFDDESDQHLSLGINNNALTTFTVFDVEPTAILPKYITLMGNDGKYLARYGDGDGGLFLGFVTSNMSGIGVAMATPQQTHPSYTCITIKGTDIAWNLNPENKSIVLEHSRHAKALFAGVKVGDLYVSLLCNISNNFLQRVSGTHGRSDGLQADTSTITEEAKLKVGEPVIAREILSATYDLHHSRVYDTITFDKYKESISNYTSVVQNEIFMVQYASENTMSWNQSLTVNVGIPVSWSFGIPVIAGGSDSSVHVVYEPDVVTCEWGKEKLHIRKVATPMKVSIPPKKKVTLRVVATKSCCDVPFTCEVRDTMTDGTTRVYTKTDGLFTGCNEYNIMHTTSMEDL